MARSLPSILSRTEPPPPPSSSRRPRTRVSSLPDIPSPTGRPAQVTCKRCGGLTPGSLGWPGPQGEEGLGREVEQVAPGGAVPVRSLSPCVLASEWF